jgi:hypothetical protein
MQPRRFAVASIERDALNRKDREIIDANADYFNREMEDILQYQVPIDELFAEQCWSTDEEQ